MALREAAVKGVTWTFAQQFSVQIINFVVQIILARLLLPEMFGLIAMLAIFISIGQMLMDSGMTSWYCTIKCVWENMKIYNFLLKRTSF